MRLLIKNVFYKFILIWIGSFVLLSYMIEQPFLENGDWLRLLFGGVKMGTASITMVYMCSMALLQYLHLDTTLLCTKEEGVLLSRLKSRKKLFWHSVRSICILNVLFCICVATAGIVAMALAEKTGWNENLILFSEMMEIIVRGFLFCVLFAVVQAIILTYVDEARAFLIMTGICAVLVICSKIKLAFLILPAPFKLEGALTNVAVSVCIMYIIIAMVIFRKRLLSRDIGIDRR